MSEIYDSKQEPVKLKNLHLDPNNFRLIHEPEYKEVPEDQIKNKIVAQRTCRLLIGDKNQHIQDLIESFKANGYLPVDQIQARKLPDGDYVVVEGNRRIGTLKYLQKEFENKGINLGNLDPMIFEKVPIVLYSLAELFNVQVFLTSHSKECIDAFVRNLKRPELLSACTLVNHDGKIETREFSGKEFHRLVEAGNVDLRSAI